MNLIEGLTFDDVLLIPRYSSLKSRSEVDLSTTIQLKNGDKFKIETPIIPANMQTVSGLEMLKVCYQYKSLGLLHRFMPFEDQLKIVDEVSNWGNGFKYIGFSIGIQADDYGFADKLVERGVRILCIDVANAASSRALDLIGYIGNKYPHVLLIAGTVGMGESAGYLWQVGADMVRSGIGSGSTCWTRITTGCGSPMITALDSCKQMKTRWEAYYERPLYLISDGGAKIPGDVCKALAVGADFAILGNMFSGCDETPGEVIVRDGREYKKYAGSSTLKNSYKEGVEALVKRKGSAASVYTKICEGLRSSCSYQDARTIKEFQENSSFMKVSSNVVRENGAHDLDIIL